MITQTTIQDIHSTLRAWRGDMKLDRAAVRLSDLLGREVSRETIRRYEVRSEAPKHMDPVLLAGLARVYGHEPSDLPPGVINDLRRLASVVDLSTRIGKEDTDPETPPDLPNAQSRCIGRSLSEDEAFGEAA